MIVFDLRCNRDHVFEAWFASSEAFDLQSKARAVSCPVCGSGDVVKALMAPAVAGSKKVADVPESARDHRDAHGEVATYFNALKELRQHVESTCEHVGERFPEEARKMHYGEAEKRNIYGDATKAEADALRDEGVECHQIPWPARQDA